MIDLVSNSFNLFNRFILIHGYAINEVINDAINIEYQT